MRRRLFRVDDERITAWGYDAESRVLYVVESESLVSVNAYRDVDAENASMARQDIESHRTKDLIARLDEQFDFELDNVDQFEVIEGNPESTASLRVALAGINQHTWL